MGKLSRDKGARFEREVATMLDTTRCGTKGKPDSTDADVFHPTLFVQCKRRARLSIGAWWRETADGAKNAGKIPLLIVREDRGEALAIVRLADLLDEKGTINERSLFVPARQRRGSGLENPSAMVGHNAERRASTNP